MIKFVLSILVLLLMPLRVLFIICIISSVALFFMLESFINKDTYFESTQQFLETQKQAEKSMNNACAYNVKCSLKLYAKGGKGELLETFYKTLNESKNDGKKSFLSSIREPIKKMIAENEIKSAMKNSKEEKNLCFAFEGDSIICNSPEMVAVFKASNCASCLEDFKKEFKILSKRKYKSFLIKMAHKTHDFFLRTFGLEGKENEIALSEKLKGFMIDNASSIIK